jgi:O-acetyl-ADP-ribose deacetylase (regulator of RNase III)
LQTFGKFVESCLRQAEEKGISSIAFPSIVTEELGYPVKSVARTMFQTVQKFAAERNRGYLKEVSFVINYEDHQYLQVIKPINTSCAYF